MKSICKDKLYSIFMVVSLVLLAGCATIIHGTTQPVGISSSPSGATVTVSGQTLGKTPVIADLKRGDNHIVKIELDGYKSFDTTLTKSVSGWVWGNILFGGLIGLAVDAISGGLYNLTPEQIQATLLKDESSKLEMKQDGLYVFVTLYPDKNWQKIGQLEKE